VALSPDGRTVLTAGEDDQARLWDAATGQSIGHPLKHPGVSTVAFSPDSRLVLTAGGDGTARLWDVETGISLGDPSPTREPSGPWVSARTGLSW